MWIKFRQFLADFKESNAGTVAVEAAIIMPLLLWSYVAVVVFFDSFRTRSATEKAAFTISDMISRETQAIDAEFLFGVHQVFDLLADSDGATSIRVSVVSFSAATDDYVLNWSQTRGNYQALVDSDMTEVKEALPAMASGETLILVETHSSFNPDLDVGLTDMDFNTFIFTRPRFVSQVVWSDA